MSIKKAEIQSRVVRLLEDRARVEDIKTILLYLRDHSFNREMLKEVGHFSAHSGERVQGLTTRHVQQNFDAVTLSTKLLKQQIDDKTQFTMRKRALRYRLETVTSQEAKAAGLKIKDVHRRGRNIIKSLAEARGDDVRFEPKLQPDDIPVLRLLLRNTVTPAITDIGLANELAEVCLKNKFIGENDTATIQGRRSSLARFVTSLIHGCEIALDERPNANLTAGIDQNQKLVVFASFAVKYDGPPTDVSFTLFQTEETARDSCSPDLLKHGKWSFPIEVGEDGLLAPLQ